MAAAGCSASRNNAQHSDAELIGTTLEGDTVQIPMSRGLPTAIILYNGYSCKDCFSETDDALDTLLKQNDIGRIAILARVGTSAMAQREASMKIQHILRPDLPILFDLTPEGVTDPWPPHDLVGGVFGPLNVTKTPGLLLVGSSGRRTFLDYDSLGFGDDDIVSKDLSRHNLAVRIKKELDALHGSIGERLDNR
jgi:hypothetical protein